MAPAPPVTPDAVRKHRGPSDGFLCPVEANTPGVQFLEFQVLDPRTGAVLFDVKHHAADLGRRLAEASLEERAALAANLEDLSRSVEYAFPAATLRSPTLRTKLMFKVGGAPVQGLKMIERHYFRDRLLRSYEFDFGFCIPDSTNSWDAEYDMPKLSEKEIADLVATPLGHRSDSFYFVGDRLIMHNKAAFSYEAA